MTRPGERAPPSSPACRAAERLALLRGASRGRLQAARGRCPRLGMFVGVHGRRRSEENAQAPGPVAALHQPARTSGAAQNTLRTARHGP